MFSEEVQVAIGANMNRQVGDSLFRISEEVQVASYESRVTSNYEYTVIDAARIVSAASYLCGHRPSLNFIVAHETFT
jgi:hypothetical protein